MRFTPTTLLHHALRALHIAVIKNDPSQVNHAILYRDGDVFVKKVPLFVQRRLHRAF